MGFDFSTVPGWAWGIRPMNVVQQTFDHIMDKEFEVLIAEIDHQIHCENLTRGFTVVALESLLNQEIQKLSLLQKRAAPCRGGKRVARAGGNPRKNERED